MKKKWFGICYVVFTVVTLLGTVAIYYLELAYPTFLSLYEAISTIIYPYAHFMAIIFGLPSMLLSYNFFFGSNFHLGYYIIPGILAILASIYLFRGEWKWKKLLFFLCHIAHAGMIYYYSLGVMPV